VGAQPIWREVGEDRERVAHRLGHELNPIQRADGGQHVRRVRPLTPPDLEQPTVTGAVDQQVEQSSLGPAEQQAGAEFAEDGVIEARIGQLQGQRVLPVDPPTHGVGRRTVGQVLGELENGGQGQTPRRFGRVPPRGEQVGEVLIRVDDVQRLPHPEVQGTVGKRGARDTRGLLRDRVRLPRVQRHRGLQSERLPRSTGSALLRAADAMPASEGRT
jgi:hypothetical protein